MPRKSPQYIPCVPDGYKRFKKTRIYCDRNGNIILYPSKGMALVVSGTVNGHGYKTFGLSDNSKPKFFYNHFVIAYCWLGPKKKGMQVNHINGIKTDNSVVNLEYCTRGENIRHAYKLGLGPHGERHPMTTLTESEVLRIRTMHKKNSVVVGELAVKFNVSTATIYNIVNRKTWAHI